MIKSVLLLLCFILLVASIPCTQGLPLNKGNGPGHGPESQHFPSASLPVALALSGSNSTKSHPGRDHNGPGHDVHNNNGNYDPHHEHDSHRHKLNKLNIQHYITQREIERHQRNEPTWRNYFPEILAALILISSLIIFICWLYFTRRIRGPSDRSHSLSGTVAVSGKRRRSSAFQQERMRRHSMPELYVNNATPPARFCSPDEARRMSSGSKVHRNHHRKLSNYHQQEQGEQGGQELFSQPYIHNNYYNNVIPSPANV